jgi:protein-S-isoprenylcysteine O-methyltransferase Ste14
MQINKHSRRARLSIALGKFFFRYRNVLAPAIFLLALALSRPHYPLGREDLNIAFDVAGVVIVLLGQLLRVVTIGYEYIVRGGRNRHVYADDLVQGGMFALSRNPLYLGNVLIAVGLALMIHAHAFYLIVIPLTVLAYSATVAAEEAYLREKFGTQYEDYCRRVNRWWPRLTQFRRSVSAMRFNWKRVLIKEYNTTFILVGLLVCLYIWTQYSVQGAGALPSRSAFLAGVLAWAMLYLTVRGLKKSGYVRE